MTRIYRIALTIAAISSALATHTEKIELEGPKRAPEQTVLTDSGEAKLALQSVSLNEDTLEIGVYATEPLLANPVAFAFDEKGRMFVAESFRAGSSVIDMRTYPDALEHDLASRTVEDRANMIRSIFADPEQFAQEAERLSLVQDTDNDGVADTTSVYAGGFNDIVDGIASGVITRKGKVWFTNIPHLWQFEGIDENGEAESKESLLEGFGVHFGFYGHDLHGLAWGPDGKLYFSIGDRGASVLTQEGNRVHFPDTGAVFRCNPDGSDFEVFATGLRNPQELIFDEFGNLFTGDNDCDNGDMERLVHVVEDGDSGWTVGHQYTPLGRAGMWMLEEMWTPRHEGQPAHIIPPVCNIQDGPSGVAYYPGTGLSPKYKNHIFICHFRGSLARSGIHTYTVKPNGATFEIESSAPFATKLLPTDVAFGPDGKLYISDWVSGWGPTGRGRIYVISHPDAQNDPLVEETQRLISEGMADRPVEELLSLLGHADQRVRLEAQFTLAERGPSSISALDKVATDEAAPILARVHATWALGQLGENGRARRVIRQLLSDEHHEIRAQAMKLAGDLRIGRGYRSLTEGLRAPNARVQFFAAQSLGKLGRKRAAPEIVELLRRNDDSDLYIRHAAYIALAKIKNLNTLRQAANDPSKAVRLGALLAMRRMKDPSIAQFLDDDPDLALEAARAINDANIEEALPALAKKLDTEMAKTNKLFGIRAINAHFRLGEAENARALAEFAQDEAAAEELRVEALRQLGAWLDPFDRGRITGLYRPLPPRDGEPGKLAFQSVVEPLLSGGSALVQRQVIESIGELNLTRSSSALAGIVRDSDRPVAARIAALDTLDRFEYSEIADLVAIAGSSESEKLRLATLPILARLSPDEATPVLSGLAEAGNPFEQRAAFTALGKMDDAAANEILAKSLDRLANNRIPTEAQLELLEAAEKANSSLIKEKLHAREERAAASEDSLKRWNFALEGGDASSGRDVFFEHAGMACVRCHKVAGEGGDAGPDLTGIAIKQDRRYLLESVVEPNADIAPGFETVVATLRSGEVVSGILIEETEETLTLKLANGDQTDLAKAEIANAARPPSSMPPVYTTLLNRHELRDLLEYLASLEWEDSEVESRALGDSH